MNIETIMWIDVKQAVAPERVTVLMFCPELQDSVFLGYYLRGGWRSDTGDNLPAETVTHWALKPKGPNEH